MGKSAFDAKRGNIFHFDPDDLVIIEDENDPLYDERSTEPVNERLVKNIMYERQGVLQPITVRKIGNQPYVVDGRQRVKANREANRRLIEMGEDPLLIPAVAWRGDDKAAFGVMISTNEHRLEDNALVKSKKLARFLNQGGTPAEAAIYFGVSMGTITNWSHILELDERVKKFISKGQLSATAATELHALPRNEQVSKAEELIQSGNATVQAAHKAARGQNTGNRAPRMRKRKEIETILQEISGTQGNGKHEIIANVLRWILNQQEEIEGLDDCV